MDVNTVVDCAYSVDDRGVAGEPPETERSLREPTLALSGEAVQVATSLLASSRSERQKKSTRAAVPAEMAGTGRNVAGDDGGAVIAEFIRTKGITRCPTACVVPTQGSVSAADRAALEAYATARDRVRREKSLRARLFWTVEFRRPGSK